MDKILEAWNWPDVILFALFAVAGWIVFMNLFSAWGGWRNLADKLCRASGVQFFSDENM